ncbi:MAG: hypothetical protein IT440_14135, partial [Phycisphaeraceae bacterium]|nr:hypothetical protein [Phycisphaeraceae bacterium]
LRSRLRLAAAELFHPRTASILRPAMEQEWDHVRSEMAAMVGVLEDQWRRWRPGIGPNHAAAQMRDEIDKVDALQKQWKSVGPDQRGLVVLRLFLHERHSSPRLRVTLIGPEGEKLLGEGNVKPVMLNHSHYTWCYPIAAMKDDQPRTIRIENTGYGGQGVCYASILTADAAWRVAGLVGVEGQVRDAHHLLRDDAFPCTLGELDTHSSYMRATYGQCSAVELRLEKQA